MNWFLWALCAALFWGMAPLFEKAGLAGAPPLVGLFYRCVGVMIGMIMLLIFWVKPQEIRAVALKPALCLIFGGFIASVVAQMFFYHGLKIGETSRVVPVSAIYPLIAFLLGVFIFRESLTPMKSAGVLMVVLGVWCLKIG
jgi:bacterial/archaeal transporter family protein